MSHVACRACHISLVACFMSHVARFVTQVPHIDSLDRFSAYVRHLCALDVACRMSLVACCMSDVACGMSHGLLDRMV